MDMEFCKLAAQEMPITPLMAYNVFTDHGHDLLHGVSNHR